MPALPSPEESPFRLPQPGAGGGDGGCGHLPFNSPPPPIRLPSSSDFRRRREREKILSRTSTRSVDSRTFSQLGRTSWPFLSTKKNKREMEFRSTGRERTNEGKRTKMSKAKFGINHWGCAVFFLVVVLLPDNLVCVGDRLVEEPAGETTHTLWPLTGVKPNELFELYYGRNGDSMNLCRSNTHTQKH